MGSLRIQPPDLPTLGRKPSWLNKAGRVDRSACLEISASELWRDIPAHRWKPIHKRNGHGPESITAVTIDAEFLYELHINRPERKLVGDYRTPKSNALKNPYDHQNRKNLKPIDWRWRAIDDYDDPPFDNPNKGEDQTKKLGLWSGDEPGYVAGWEQVVVLQRWELGIRDSGFGNRDHTISLPRSAGEGQGGGVCGGPPSVRHFLTCPNCNQKKYKLFMVLATEQEVADAEIAEGWVKMTDAMEQKGIRVSGIGLRGKTLTAEDTEGAEKMKKVRNKNNKTNLRALSDLRGNSSSKSLPCSLGGAGEGQGGGKRMITAEHTEGTEKMNRVKNKNNKTNLRALSDLRGKSPQSIPEIRAELIDRYGLLFRTRRLVCGKCLNVRYGEVKAKRRNWKRKNAETEASDMVREPTAHGSKPIAQNPLPIAHGPQPLISPAEFETAVKLMGKDPNEVMAKIRQLIGQSHFPAR